MVQQGELQGFFGSNRVSNSLVKMIPRDDSKLSNSIFPRHWISSSSVVSGGPVTRSKRTHPWMSGVTMLVRWLCSFPASALLAQVGRCVLARRQNCLLRWMGPTRSSPASRKCTPRQLNQQATSCPRSAKATSVSVVLLSLDFGQGMHPNSLE